MATNSKLGEIVYLYMTSMCAPIYNVKTKRSQKIEQIYLTSLQSVIPSYFEHVDIIHSMYDSFST